MTHASATESFGALSERMRSNRVAPRATGRGAGRVETLSASTREALVELFDAALPFDVTAR